MPSLSAISWRMFSESRLGAEDAAGDFELGGGVVAHLDGRVGDEQGVGGRAGQDVGAAVLHHLHLALGVAGRGGDHGAAHGFAPGMRAQAAREQAVAVGHLDGGLGRAAHHGDAAGEAVAPVRQVLGRVAHDRGLAGGAAGGVDARHVLGGNGEQAERVGVAHVLLHDERELRQVFQAVQVVGRHSRFRERLSIELHVVVGMAHRGAHAFELERAQLFARHRFDFWLIVHVCPSLVFLDVTRNPPRPC